MTAMQKSLSRKEKVSAFHIQTLEAMDQDCSFRSVTPQKLSHFEFIWLKGGIGSLTVDFQEYTFAENIIYCLCPGQCRQVQADSRIEGYYITLSMDFYYMLKGQLNYTLFLDRFSYGWNTTLLTPEIERLHEFNDIIQLMLKEYNRSAFSGSDLLSGFLNIFLLYLSRDMAVNTHCHKREPDADKVMQFMALVKKNFLTKRKVKDYANEMTLTPDYLNHIVKKISGFSASYHIQQCIILEAKRQVISENMRLKELACYLGFDDCAHFSKYFKNKCGMNFTSFRNVYING